MLIKRKEIKMQGGTRLVRFFSDALCTITAEAKNSATIVEKKIGGTVVTGNTHTITGIETSSVAFSAKDSRGYETSVSVALDLIPYVKLTNNPVGQRTDPTSGNAVLKVSGNYYNGSFGASENALSIRYGYAAAGSAIEEYMEVDAGNITLDGNTYSAEISLSGLDYESAFTFDVIVSDLLDSVTKTANVNKGISIFDFGEKDFKFNVPVCVSGSSVGDTPPDDALPYQVFFQKKSDGTYAVKIYNGSECIV